jgi:arsenate reductase (thioredoxin)
MINDKIMNVLFLCTGNSARSIMAEALLQQWGRGTFMSYSAGSLPKGEVNPLVLEILADMKFSTEQFRSKSWEEFSVDGAPSMDFVFTVCDRAANEACPIWPGQPMSAHWSIEDPDRPDLSEEEQQKLFKKAFWELDHRIKIFTSMPFDKLDNLSLQKQLDDIGKLFPNAS